MPETRKEPALRVFRGEETDRLPFYPITMMFAADLAGRPFLEYATDATVLCAGQLKMPDRTSTGSATPHQGSLARICTMPSSVIARVGMSA